MRTSIIAALAMLGPLVLSSACTGTAVGSIPESPPKVDDDPSPPKKTLADADASVPDELKCGGFPFNAQACGTCGASKCCDSAAACWGDTECHALYTCISACSDASCKDDCGTDHARGLTKYNALGTCAETKCSTECASPSPAPAAKKGIGDRCTEGSECREGSCSGTPGWCTTACTQNEDCSGYPQLSNEYGKLNYCLETASGSRSCFPGCSTDADCTKYASGLTCKSAGNGVFVCSL